MVLAAHEQALRTNWSSTAQIRHLRHHRADCVVTALKKYGTLSADVGSLSRVSIGNATTRWLFGYTGSYAESMG